MRDLTATKSRVGRALGAALSFLACGVLLIATPSTSVAGRDEDRKTFWIERHQEVTREYGEAFAELEEANLALRKARQRNRFKGARRSEIEANLEAAQTRYSAAKKAMDEFPKKAQRAGAEPGWFR